MKSSLILLSLSLCFAASAQSLVVNATPELEEGLASLVHAGPDRVGDVIRDALVVSASLGQRVTKISYEAIESRYCRVDLELTSPGGAKSGKTFEVGLSQCPRG